MKTQHVSVSSVVDTSLQGSSLLESLTSTIMSENRKADLRGHLLLTDQLRHSEETSEELKRLLSVKDRMLSIISHDVRAPLATLNSLLLLLAKRGITQAERDEIIMNLNVQIEQLGTFLENLLHRSKKSFTQIKPNMSKATLQKLVEETIHLLTLYATRKQVVILEEIPKEIMICADAEMIKLVLRNLISNAIKFCNKHDKVYVQATQERELVRVSITDTGPGIDEKLLASLFNLPHLITRGNKDELGVGLGLTLCKEFVEHMGGNIYAWSVPGNGSRFEFTVQRFRKVVAPIPVKIDVD